MQELQIQIIKIIQSVHSPLLDTLFQWITMTGEELFLLAVVAGIIWVVDKEKGFRIAFILLSSMLVNTVLKVLVASARPIGLPEIRSLRVETATGASFPSGHTQNVTVFWSALTLLFKRQSLALMGVLMTLLVACSRLYLGVHWPIDVFGAMVVGVLWTALANAGLNWMTSSDKRYILLFAAVPLLGYSLWTGDATYIKATGVMLGFVAGYMLEHRYVGYHCGGSLVKRLTTALLCLIVLLGAKAGLKILFPPLPVFEALRYALLGAGVSAGGPWVMKRFCQGRCNK